MKKDTILLLFSLCLAIGLAYVAASFISLDWNFRNWHIYIRAVSVAGAAITTLIINLMVDTDEKPQGEG